MTLAGTLRILAAVLVLATTPALAADDPLTTEQRRAVGEIVREYLRKHPEVLLEAIQALREKQEAETRDKAKVALSTRRGELENDPATPVGGNPQGNVTIVEFFDYRCGYCKRVFPAIQELLKADGNIRYVFKEFPILGPESRVASRAALAVWNQDRDKYMAFHTALMSARGSLSEKRVLSIAADTGLDVAKLKAGMADPAIDQALAKTHALARALNINGTPAFVIGDNLIPGAIDIATLKHLVSQVRGSS